MTTQTLGPVEDVLSHHGSSFTQLRGSGSGGDSDGGSGTEMHVNLDDTVQGNFGSEPLLKLRAQPPFAGWPC